MNQYEVTFIVDPVLSGDEIEGTATSYIDHLKGEGCEIVNKEDIGLRQLAYSIKKRTTGVYYCLEFTSVSGNIIPKLELALRRDERIMRFLTVRLDKYGVKYNDDKRNGLIGRKREEEESEATEKPAAEKPKPKPEPKAAAAAVAKPVESVESPTAVKEEEE